MPCEVGRDGLEVVRITVEMVLHLLVVMLSWRRETRKQVFPIFQV